MNIREQFEQEMTAKGWGIQKTSLGDYIHERVALMWMAWQAASKASEQQLSESRREFTAANVTIHNLDLKVCELKSKGLECVREASLVYSKYNDTQMPDRDIVDMQTLQELHDICKADDVGDALLAEVRYQGRAEGINFAASRIAAAYNNGFIDKPFGDVDDVVRAILSAKGELGNNLPEDGLSGEYAEKSLVEFAAQLRQAKSDEVTKC